MGKSAKTGFRVSMSIVLGLLAFAFTHCSTSRLGFTTYTQAQKNHTTAIDLEAAPPEVYQATLRCAKRENVIIIKQDDAQLKIDGGKNDKTFSVQITPRENGMSRLTLTVDAGESKNVVSSNPKTSGSTSTSGPSSGMSLTPSVQGGGPTDGEIALRVLDAVCAEVGPKAKCKVAK
jgi:hypothetical protein